MRTDDTVTWVDSPHPCGSPLGPAEAAQNRFRRICLSVIEEKKKTPTVSMRIPSTPGAPLLALTRFHASAILAVETTCSTDARSIGDGLVTRRAPNSPVGVNELHELTGIPHHTAFGPFPGTPAGFSSSADFCPMTAYLRNHRDLGSHRTPPLADLPG